MSIWTFKQSSSYGCRGLRPLVGDLGLSSLVVAGTCIYSSSWKAVRVVRVGSWHPLSFCLVATFYFSQAFCINWYRLTGSAFFYFFFCFYSISDTFLFDGRVRTVYDITFYNKTWAFCCKVLFDFWVLILYVYTPYKAERLVVNDGFGKGLKGTIKLDLFSFYNKLLWFERDPFYSSFLVCVIIDDALFLLNDLFFYLS